MSDSYINLNLESQDIKIKAVDNGDGTYSVATAGGSSSSVIGATKDAGPYQTVTRTFTASSNMTSAAALTVAPATGQKIVLMDVLISTDTNMLFDLEMETSGNILAAFYLPSGSFIQPTLRGYLKGDTADKKIYGKANVAGNVKVTTVYFSEA